MSKSKGAAGNFLVVGLLLLAVAAGLQIYLSSGANNEIETSGTVVDIDAVSRPGKGTRYRPIVEYTDARNTTHRIIGKVASRPLAYARGETVTVIYDEDDPADAVIDSFTEGSLLPIVFGAFGLIFVVVGGGKLMASR